MNNHIRTLKIASEKFKNHIRRLKIASKRYLNVIFLPILSTNIIALLVKRRKSIKCLGFTTSQIFSQLLALNSSNMVTPRYLDKFYFWYLPQELRDSPINLKYLCKYYSALYYISIKNFQCAVAHFHYISNILLWNHYPNVLYIFFINYLNCYNYIIWEQRQWNYWRYNTMLMMIDWPFYHFLSIIVINVTIW